MIKPRVYTKRVLLLITILSVLRIVVSASINLTNDESYYWLYSQILKWNYFDHPPMVAVWIRIFTINLLLEKYEVFLRFGSVVGCALATWLMFKCVSTISTERAGWFAACLYNASFYAGITSGLLILPDAPQMVFYTFSLWMIAKITIDDKNWITWIFLGIASGLCIMSKVHGVFIWIGLGFYILSYKKTWLINARMYSALLIALIITSPILFWNIQYDFITYHFNINRIVIKGFPFDFKSFFSELVGEIFINNPFNVIFILLSLVVLIKRKNKFPRALSIYNFIGLPLIFILLSISFFRTTLPHWSGPGYVALLPLAAINLAEINNEIICKKLIQLSLGMYVVFMIACPIVINYYPGTFSSKINRELGKGDLSIDMYGWKEAGKRFDTLYKKETESGMMAANSPMVCNKWWGAHAEYYFCRPLNIQMIGLGEINELHEYMWMNKIRKSKVNISSAYCIVNSDDYYDVHEHYDNYYRRIEPIEVIQVFRGNKPCHNFYVYRLKGEKNTIPPTLSGK